MSSSNFVPIGHRNTHSHYHITTREGSTLETSSGNYKVGDKINVTTKHESITNRQKERWSMFWIAFIVAGGMGIFGFGACLLVTLYEWMKDEGMIPKVFYED